MARQAHYLVWSQTGGNTYSANAVHRNWTRSGSTNAQGVRWAATAFCVALRPSSIGHCSQRSQAQSRRRGFEYCVPRISERDANDCCDKSVSCPNPEGSEQSNWTWEVVEQGTGKTKKEVRGRIVSRISTNCGPQKCNFISVNSTVSGD